MAKVYARFLGKSSYAVSAVCVTLLALATIELAPAQQDRETRPKVSDEPFTAEQLVVYRAALMSWYKGEKAVLNLAIQTDPIDSDDNTLDKA